MEGVTTTYVNFELASSLPELGTRWANRMAIWTSWLLIGSAVRFHRQLGSEMRPYGGHDMALFSDQPSTQQITLPYNDISWLFESTFVVRMFPLESLYFTSVTASDLTISSPATVAITNYRWP
jgi:hypothetical protein